MIDKNPLISVLMGVYYQKADISLLRRSVESILAQSVSDFEFLICDDGSSPDAKAYLDRLARQDSRIILIRSGNLFSLPQKLNACLNRARGTLIARMDDDDYSYPNRFAEQLAFLESNPAAAFVGCNVNLRRCDKTVGLRSFPEWPEVRDFYLVQPFIHPTLFFRADVLRSVGGYCENKHCILCEDYDLLLRLYASGHRGANMQTPLFDYTIPATAKGNRKMRHRWNETVTRYRRFHQLNCLPSALPYVVKPLVVGLIPEYLLKKLKHDRNSF